MKEVAEALGPPHRVVPFFQGELKERSIRGIISFFSLFLLGN